MPYPAQAPTIDPPSPDFITPLFQGLGHIKTLRLLQSATTVRVGVAMYAEEALIPHPHFTSQHMPWKPLPPHTYITFTHMWSTIQPRHNRQVRRLGRLDQLRKVPHSEVCEIGRHHVVRELPDAHLWVSRRCSPMRLLVRLTKNNYENVFFKSTQSKTLYILEANTSFRPSTYSPQYRRFFSGPRK